MQRQKDRLVTVAQEGSLLVVERFLAARVDVNYKNQVRS